MEIEAVVEAEAEAERESYEGAKRSPMRRLRGNGASEVDSDAEVAELQKRVKETDGEAAREGDLKREGAKIESDKGETKLGYEMYLEWKRKKDEEEERNWDPERLTDRKAYEAKMFRKRWDEIYLKLYGSFDKKTEIPCKRFTHNPPPSGGTTSSTLQMFHVKVEGISGGLKWPLEVFGLVALRDSLDHNRNIIFERERDNCQMLTDENPYLALTGPVRAVMLYDLVIFEASLYVKGASRSDDKELSLLATSLGSFNSCRSSLIERHYRSRLSTLELMFGHIIYSVEATIEVRLTSGPWPDGFRCRFSAYTDTIGPSIMLLETADDRVPRAGDKICLARQVLSVETNAKLIVVASITNGNAAYTDRKSFKPLEMGSNSEEFNIGVCMLEVTVYWSLFPMHPFS